MNEFSILLNVLGISRFQTCYEEIFLEYSGYHFTSVRQKESYVHADIHAEVQIHSYFDLVEVV